MRNIITHTHGANLGVWRREKLFASIDDQLFWGAFSIHLVPICDIFRVNILFPFKSFKKKKNWINYLKCHICMYICFEISRIGDARGKAPRRPGWGRKTDFTQLCPSRTVFFPPPKFSFLRVFGAFFFIVPKGKKRRESWRKKKQNNTPCRQKFSRPGIKEQNSFNSYINHKKMFNCKMNEWTLFLTNKII